MEKTYGGHTVAALREFLQHGDDTGETIDELTGNDASSANIIRDLLAALAHSDVVGAPLPVAWRYQTPTGWHATTDSAAAARVADHHEVQPLYATPVAPAAGVPTLSKLTGWRMRIDGKEAIVQKDGLGGVVVKADDANIAASILHALVQDFFAAPTPTVAADAAAPSEDAYVAQRMTETLAEVYATILGDDAPQEDESLNAIERVKKAAQVLRLEVDLYRAQRDEAAAQPDERAAQFAEDLRAEQTYLASCREMCSEEDELPRWDRLQRVIDYLDARATTQQASSGVPAIANDRIHISDSRVWIQCRNITDAVKLAHALVEGAIAPQAVATLTDEQREIISEAVRSISIRADELKESNTSIDGAWCDDDEHAQYLAEVMLVGQLRTLLAAHAADGEAWA